MTIGNDIIINLGKRIIAAQEALQACTWLEVIYGRAWKSFKKIEGKQQPFIYPEVYLSNKEYKDMMPNDKLRAFCFFVPKDPARYVDYKPNINNECYQTVDIIFWYNYKLINQFIDMPFIDAVYHDVKEALKPLSFVSIEALYTEPAEVYKGFSINEVETQYLRFPFGGFRLQCKISFLDDCQPFFFDEYVTPPIYPEGKLIGIDLNFDINSNNPLANKTVTAFRNFILANKLDFTQLKAALKAGTNVTINADDNAKTLTISSTGGGGGATDITGLTNSSTTQTSITDSWYFQLWVSGTTWYKATGTNIKAWLKSYFDGIYATIGTLAGYLKLDQSTPQTLTGGIPLSDQDITAFNQDKQFIIKEYVDNLARGGNKLFYFTKDASDVAGMYKALTYFPNAALQIFTHSAVDGESIIASFITDVATQDYIVTDGARFFHFVAKVSNTSKPCQLKGYVYLTDLLGANPVLLRTSTLSMALTLTDAEYIVSVIGDTRLIDRTTTRVKFVVAVVKTGTGLDPTVTLSVNDDTFSRLEVPSPVGVTDISGLLKLDQTTEQTISNGTPKLDRTIAEITDPKHLTTKEFVESLAEHPLAQILKNF